MAHGLQRRIAACQDVDCFVIEEYYLCKDLWSNTSTRTKSPQKITGILFFSLCIRNGHDAIRIDMLLNVLLMRLALYLEGSCR